MKRSAALVVLLAALLIASVALLLPLAPCTVCTSAIEYPDFPFAIGCPRCKDGGRMSWLSRWIGRSPDQDLKILLNCYRHPEWEEQGKFYPTMRRLAARSNRTLDAFVFRNGSAVFVDDEGDPRVAAGLHYTYDPNRLPLHRVELVLFDLDGRILDFVEVSGSEKGKVIRDSWSAPPRSALAVEFEGEGETAEGFQLKRGSDRTSIRASKLGLRARNGRFEAIPAEETSK